MPVTGSEGRTHRDMGLAQLGSFALKLRQKALTTDKKKKNDHMWAARGLL